MHDTVTAKTSVKLVLYCLALVLLSCAAKNYLAYALVGTPLCPSLCPSPLGWDSPDTPVLIERLFGFQAWIKSVIQNAVTWFIPDPHALATSLVAAPLMEEVIYRGPLFLVRNRLKAPYWWLAGIVLAVVFAASHGRSGVSMLPLFVLGIGSLWLITATRRFWPSLLLHFLYNFFMASIVVYASLWIAD